MRDKLLIIIISVIIPVVVAILFFMPKISGFEIDFLPKVNATLNGTVFFTLIFAIRAIKNGNKRLHTNLILTSLVFSTLFLGSYVLHHSTHDSVHFGGEGFVKYIYFFVLLSHILLSAIVLPLVLITLSRALKEKFDLHKKIAKITFPIWLYVSASGVLVYILISPYY